MKSSKSADSQSAENPGSDAGGRTLRFR